MKNQKPFHERFKADPIMHIIALLSILYGIGFFLINTSKLFRVEAAEAEFAQWPCGRFDWGYVWSDTLVLGPMLLVGGIILLVWYHSRLGQLFAFTGFAINLYATVFLTIGLKMVDFKMSGGAWAFLVVPGLLGLLCMFYLVKAIVKTPPNQ
jgi:hypothetical protein